MCSLKPTEGMDEEEDEYASALAKARQRNLKRVAPKRGFEEQKDEPVEAGADVRKIHRALDEYAAAASKISPVPAVYPASPVYAAASKASPVPAVYKTSPVPAVSSASPIEPTLHALLGSGAFGCVLSKGLPCVGAITEEFKLGSAARAQVFKLQDDANYVNGAAVNAVLRVVDSNSTFTVPFDSVCKVNAYAAKAACAVLSGSKPVLQIGMRRGEPLEQALEKDSIPAAPLLRMLVTLIQGALMLHRFGIVHGDIKVANVLYFHSEAVLRLIDYDYMFSYAQDFPVRIVAPGTDWRSIVRSFGPYESLSRMKHMALGANDYFPPEIWFMVFALYQANGQRGVSSAARHVRAGEYSADIRPQYARTFAFTDRQWRDEMAALQAQLDTVIVKGTLTPDWVYKHAYFPDKYTVYQLGVMLFDMIDFIEDNMSPGPKAALRDVICAMTHPLPDSRCSLQDALAQLKVLVR